MRGSLFVLSHPVVATFNSLGLFRGRVFPERLMHRTQGGARNYMLEAPKNDPAEKIRHGLSGHTRVQNYSFVIANSMAIPSAFAMREVLSGRDAYSCLFTKI